MKEFNTISPNVDNTHWKEVSVRENIDKNTEKKKKEAKNEQGRDIYEEPKCEEIRKVFKIEWWKAGPRLTERYIRRNSHEVDYVLRK